MDGTPIYDIKPYLAYVDSHPEAAGGFTDQIQDHKLKVEFPEKLLKKIPEEKREALLAVLANDPRPGYQKDPERKYGMSFGSWDIQFKWMENSCRYWRYLTLSRIKSKKPLQKVEFFHKMEKKFLRSIRIMRKVVKFGGSSLANAEQFEKVGDIIRSEESRRFVVPSAQVKRFDGDTKVTDLLYSCYDAAANGGDFEKVLEEIKSRYYEIIKGLGLALSMEEDFQLIKENFKAQIGRDYAASRGEYLNGKVMAAYLGYEFVDAAEVIRFDKNGNLDSEKTDKLLNKRLSKCENAVVGYGLWYKGRWNCDYFFQRWF